MPGYSTAEIDLADRARGGDLRALEELHGLYHQRLYHHALRMLQDPSAAQDVVQEAFTRAIAEIHRTRPSLKFKAWIYRITTNLCLRHLNRRRRWAAEARTTEDQNPTPEQNQLRSELAEHLTRALAELPPRYRQVLLLRELEGLSYREISEVLQLKESPLKVLLHRARLRLAALLIAEQLSRDTTVTVRCAALTGLMVREASKRQMVRHIERCVSCRERERRPAAELFALLPPVGAIPGGAARFPGIQDPTGLLTRIAWWLGSSWRWVTGGATVAAAVLLVLVATRGQPQSPAPAQVAAAMAAARPAQIDPGSSLPRVDLASVEQGRSAAPASSDRPAMVGIPQHTSPRASAEFAESPLALIPPLSPPPRVILPYRPWPLRPDEQRPLAIKVLPPHDHLEIRRGHRFIPFKSSDQLERGDLLTSRSAKPFALRFPGGQWLACDGRLKIDQVSLRGQEPVMIMLVLLEGELRAGATVKGRGFRITLGEEGASSAPRSRILAEQGEFRVHLAAGTAEVAAHDAYLQLQGPHAPRTLTPGAGLTVTGRVSFPRQLLAPALRLRPVQGCMPQRPRLSWSAVSGSGGYQVRLGGDPHFLTGPRKIFTADPWIQLGRLPAGKYFWMVQAVDQARLPGQASKIYSFSVGGSCSS